MNAYKESDLCIGKRWIRQWPRHNEVAVIKGLVAEWRDGEIYEEATMVHYDRYNNSCFAEEGEEFIESCSRNLRSFASVFTPQRVLRYLMVSEKLGRSFAQMKREF